MSILDQYGKPIDTNIDLKSDHKRNIDQQTYYASEEFNALRKELYDYHRPLWDKIGGAMVWDPPLFVEYMEQELKLVYVGFDSFQEAGHCKRLLNALRKRRGVSEL